MSSWQNVNMNTLRAWALFAFFLMLIPQYGNAATLPSGALCPQISRSMARGARGGDVLAMQRYLIALGLLASDAATGFFGPITEAAVQQFQCKNMRICSGAPTTTGYGNVGPGTRAIFAACGVAATSVTASVSIATPPIVSALPPNITSSVTVVPPMAVREEPKPAALFLIAGQSNAQGYGDAAQSVTAPAQAFAFNGGTLVPATDPVGNAQTGSAWPAFARTYANGGTEAVVLIPAARGGTGQTAVANTGAGSWVPGGELFASSISAYKAANAHVASRGYAPYLRGVLWSQGENDAIAINKGLQSAADYKADLQRMIAQYRAELGATTAFYLFQTGTSHLESDAGYAAVRAAQNQVALEDPYTYLVFTGAAGFPARQFMKDAYHYTQQGYNEMGQMGAVHVMRALDLASAQSMRTCSFNGTEVAHGTSRTAYRANTVTDASQCVSEIRSCNDGILSGSYEFAACTVAAVGGVVGAQHYVLPTTSGQCTGRNVTLAWSNGASGAIASGDAWALRVNDPTRTCDGVSGGNNNVGCVNDPANNSSWTDYVENAIPIGITSRSVSVLGSSIEWWVHLYNPASNSWSPYEKKVLTCSQ